MTPAFGRHPGLSVHSRLQRINRTHDTISALEWLTLIGVGIIAAAISVSVNLHLGIPGHAILKVVFPIAAGLALVPRRGAGSVIGVSAIITATSLRFAGFGGSGLGMGAFTSLIVIGPILDFSLSRARSCRSVYLGFMLAGFIANLSAFLVRGSFKLLGLEHVGGRPLSLWLSQSVVTYTLSGLAAGFISALVWFCARPQTPQNERELSE